MCSFEISDLNFKPRKHNNICLEAVVQRCSVKKGVLKNFTNFTGKHLCQSLFFNKKTLAQVFPRKICEIYKNTFFIEHFWWLLLYV